MPTNAALPAIQDILAASYVSTYRNVVRANTLPEVVDIRHAAGTGELW
ncbi:hypothetical protein OH799_05025 [Nocardia sp. NBC_00881]|nr:hypothetical protein OH799_05025 [Nocardia sp. NBC_00881]